jgi:hypothetical protein
MRRIAAIGGGVAAATILQVTPALACGGLVAPDGDVRLDKATTFVAWHNGVEHYVTSFAYEGKAADVGWIVPLPSVPTKIEAAGKWTLQRLEREFNPPPRFFVADGAAVPQAASSIVVEQVQVEALDITVLKGSGQAVIDWCIHNGFLLPPETKDHLLAYAKGSPVFMAAKYNTSVAQQRGQNAGDGVPLLITMNTPQLWVPLEVLADDNTQVVADLFLLTDNQLRAQNSPLFFAGLFGGQNVDGAAGFTLVRQQAMSDALHQDLAGDRNMSWVPATGYVSYLTLNAASDTVTYDLGIGSDSVIRLASFGTTPSQTVLPSRTETTMRTAAIVLAITLPGLLGTLGFVVLRMTRRRAQ